MTTVHLITTLGGTGGGAGTVTSVNDVAPIAGDVTLAKADIGLGNVDNTADADKPVSTATTTALAGKVPTTRTVAGHALSADVTLAKADVGLGSVDNTADTAKPVSTAQQTALDAKAPLASPTLTGTPAAPTAAPGTNSTQIATTAFIKAAIDALVAGAPGALDTLAEIATQLASDESAVSALTTTVAGKVPATRTVAGHALSADVTLVKADVGLGNVDNTADADKPVSSATATALGAKADDTLVVHLAGTQTITGAKTFNTAPSVPDNSWTISDTNGLQSALDGKVPLAGTGPTRWWPPAASFPVSGMQEGDYIGIFN